MMNGSKWITMLVFVLAMSLTWIACDTEEKDVVTTEPTEIETSEEAEPAPKRDSIVLMEREFSNGKFATVMPFEWSDYIMDTIFRKTGEPFITTFKYRSTVDSNSAIGISYGVNDNVPPTYLQRFISNLETEARQQPNLRKIDKKYLKLEDRETGVISYSVWDGKQEIDYSVIAAGILNKNILTLNIYFKGPVTPEQVDAANLMVRSLKVNP